MNAYEFSVRTADGGVQALSEFAGRYLLIVNVASKCGFTPQYAGLESLYQAHRDRGLHILGFPCNQFGAQEPGSDADIQQFCASTYQVSFPVFAKIDVNGPNADPLYRFLRAQAPGDFGPANGRLYDHIRASRPETLGTDEIKWNFTKFLIGPEGRVIQRYEPTTAPEQVGAELDDLLAA